MGRASQDAATVPTTDAEPPLILYDADCGFCTRCAAWVERAPFAVRLTSLHETDLPALGIDPDRASQEMPVLCEDGSVRWGHHAWAKILSTGPLPTRILGRVLDSRVMERPAHTVYRLIAQNRHRMPGSDGTCAVSRPVGQE